MKKKAAPNPKLIRQRLLERIREATLPDDANDFTRQELEAAGMFNGFKHPKDWDDKTFRLFVLFATQAKELRKECKRLRHEVEIREDYHSPRWEDVGNEPCPIKQADLRYEAEAEDARVNEERRKQRDPLSAIAESSKHYRSRKWEFRDARRWWSPNKPALWHEPMTVMDYHEATGLSRRTAQNIVDRLGVLPDNSQRRRNEPALYGQAANVAVLNEWLTHYQKKPENRKGLIARTLIHCKFESPEHREWMEKALQPAIQSLKLSRDDFSRYLSVCEKILHPFARSPVDYARLKFDAPGISAFLGKLPSA
jgi:hypothetical protein